MPWYKSGTVSITQNTNAVIGTGTAFIANSRVGDGFRGPDGRWYEVTNIASNTALSISPNYEGPTVAGGFYSIMPVQGYQKDLADQVRSWVNTYGPKMAALGSTGNYEILPIAKGGTGVAAASNAALLAAIGAMPIEGGAYIPSFNSVRVRVSASYNLGQGGYVGWNDPGDSSGFSGHMAFTANRGGGSGGFSWRSILQDNSAGGPTMTYSYDGILNVPAGLKLANENVIEYGSNASGRFVKFAGGLMISETAAATVAVGAGGVTGGSISLPASFINSNFTLSISGAAATSNDHYGFTSVTAINTSSVTWIFRNGVTAQNIANVRVTAIGRWK
ncbi:phage tail protein [Pseudomonas fluorescens]|uniref:phage tail protein n=1 Tax=Pseudomonas fluorescens TaxID=294 RepID=UPI001254545F|nr:hypothetical protein PS898_02023 [Pseudomonas fluorescens]